MDLPVSSPVSSSDDLYRLADEPAVPSKAPAPTTPAAKAPASVPPVADTSPTTPAPAEGEKAEAKVDKEQDKPSAPPKPRKIRRVRRRFDAPAWVVSAVVHVGILVTLMLITFQDQVKQTIKDLNTSLAPPGSKAEETPQSHRSQAP